MDFAAHGGAHTGSGSDHDILLDDLSLPPNPVTGSSSVIIGMEHGGKLPSDSDVRLVPDNPKGASDSDVRLASPHNFKAPSDSDVTLIADDTSQHDALGPGSGDTAVRQSPLIGSSAEVPVAHPDSDSDFELTPSSVIDALQPESGSDFELQRPSKGATSSSHPAPQAGRLGRDGRRPGPFRGSALSRPGDSGINLQMASGLGLGQADSIELAPLSGDDLPAAKAPKAKPKAAPKKAPMSATPPPAARKGDKDIFDDTDFEVDALEVGRHRDDERPFSSRPQATSSSKRATAAPRCLRSTRKTLTRTPRPRSARFRWPTRTRKGTTSSAKASGEMSAAGRGTSKVSRPLLQTPGRGGGGVAHAPAANAGRRPSGARLWVGIARCRYRLHAPLLAFVSMDLVRNLYDFRSDTPASGIVKSIAGIIAP